jgi:hypothetical protein
MKVLRHAKDASEQEKRRFLEEARAASALNHPNIVQIYELESDGQTDFIVMELIRGETLARVIAAQRLSIPEAVGYIVQIASALTAAHAAGIIHRDIKPENMIVSGSGLLKVLDFGLAKRGPKSTQHRLAASASLSSMFGTAGYMSPEQVQGKAVDARSDVFSTGAVAYELLTGRRAFDVDSDVTVRDEIGFAPPIPIREICRNIPTELADVVTRCLQEDPAARYASGAELAAALAGLGPAAPVSHFQGWARVLAAAVLTISLALAGWLLYRNTRETWVRNHAVPEIRRLRDAGDDLAAFDLLRTAQHESPTDPELKRLRSEMIIPMDLTTAPAGARVSYRQYGARSAEWRQLGQTPLLQIEVPIAHLQLRIEADGFETMDVAVLTPNVLNQTFALRRSGSVPPGMVIVPQLAAWAGVCGWTDG